jgi:hypothetical protein
MAEPTSLYVSLMASIGTLIQLSETVVDYLRSTAGAKKEKEKLLAEIISTFALVNELKNKSGIQ